MVVHRQIGVFSLGDSSGGIVVGGGGLLRLDMAFVLVLRVTKSHAMYDAIACFATSTHIQGCVARSSVNI